MIGSGSYGVLGEGTLNGVPPIQMLEVKKVCGTEAFATHRSMVSISWENWREGLRMGLQTPSEPTLTLPHLNIHRGTKTRATAHPHSLPTPQSRSTYLPLSQGSLQPGHLVSQFTWETWGNDLVFGQDQAVSPLKGRNGMLRLSTFPSAQE